MRRRRSLVALLAAALAARRSLATGMFRLRRPCGNPVAAESEVRPPAPAGRSGVPALGGVASAFVIKQCLSAGWGEGWEPGHRGPSLAGRQRSEGIDGSY